MNENKEINTEIAIPVVVVDPERVTTQPVDQVIQNNLKVSPSESISPTNPTNLPGDKVADDMQNIPEDVVDEPEEDDVPFSTDVQNLHTKISVLLSILSSMLSELDDTDENDVEETPACDAPKTGCNPSMSCLPGCMNAAKLTELEEAASSYQDSFYRLKVKYGKETAASDKPSDYLVVEDRSKSSTWHLQVKTNGKPNHRLMGGAWAALHGGYRGNKYEGPKKQEALKKLKALYKREGLETPSE